MSSQNECMDSPAGYGVDYPSYVVSDTATYQGDYLSFLVIDSLEWRNDLNDAYATSPLSSPGLFTPQDVKSQNYFERPFSAALQPSSLNTSASGDYTDYSVSYQQIVPPPNWNPNSTGGIAPDVPSNMPHSLASPCALANDDEIDIIEQQSMYSYGSSNAYTGEKSSETTFKSAWGSLNEPRRYSDDPYSDFGRESSRSKEKIPQEQSRGLTISSTWKWRQLRSTRAGKKINFYEKREEEKMETSSTRTSHNLVEKQYRKRLNAQFSTLLEALPPESVDSGVEVHERDASGAEKKVSKAEVLVLARRRIELLEREKGKLEGVNNALLQNMQRLKGEWVGMGGQVLP